MKKIIYLITLTAFTFLFKINSKAVSIPEIISEEYRTITGIINRFGDWIRALSIVALLGIISYGGYIKLTAGASPEKNKQAALMIKSAIIGFLIIILAPLIVDTIGAILGINLLSSPSN